MRNLPELDETVWTLVAERQDLGTTRYEVAFGPEGELTSYNPRDHTPDDDRWERRGATVKLLINNGHVMYRGRFVDSERIEGEAVNVKGHRWPFALQRVH